MIIEFLKPYSLSMNEDFEFISVFLKGKNKKPNPNTIRILVRGVKTGKECMLCLESRPNFFGRKDNYHIGILYVDEYITPDHIKTENKRYNYYRYSNNISIVHRFFKIWRKGDPMVHNGNMTHSFISKIGSKYTGAYKFDNKIY
jgi:hypothetical protein